MVASQIALAVLLVSIPPLHLTGNEPGYWDNTAIICAQVVEKSTESRPSYMMLKPAVSIAGNIDPTVTESIRVSLVWTDRRDLCAVGRHAIFVLDRLEGSWAVTETRVGFMPRRAPIAEIDGLGDEKVAEVIERVRALRNPKVPFKLEPSIGR